MKKLKPLLTIFLFTGIVLAVAWYFFIKPWDFKIYFSLKTQPSVVYQGILDWHEWNRKTVHEGKINTSGHIPWEKLITTLDLEDTTLILNWEITQKNDSLTKVTVGISDKQRTFYNRLRIPFYDTSIEKSVTKNILILRKKIDDLSKRFKYHYIGESDFSEVKCVYISTKSTVRGKATEMMKNVIKLNMFVKDNSLELNGDPFVLVKQWSPSNDSILFDFCFPVLHPELMPEHPDVKIKTVSVKKALKGEFYGNYSISDMAWYRLFNKAKKLEKKCTGQIVEVFYNDPHSGGDELKWKAEIYLEIE